MAKNLADEMAASRAFGPNHPEALTARTLVADALNQCGRCDETLSVLKDVIAKQEAHPSLGPEHPQTLRERSLHARVLDNCNRPAEALAIIEDVAKRQAATLGADHPDLVTSQQLLTNLQHKLGR